MEYNYYVYEKPDLKILINRMPKWFREMQCDGDQEKGIIILNSHDEYDEKYGSNAVYEVSWEKKERLEFFHYKEVQRSIDMYNAVNWSVLKKETDWLLSHEYTQWFGKRTKMIRKSYYKEQGIHRVFYCDMTNRLFNIHCTVVDPYFENYKPYLLESFKSFNCH